MFNSHIDLDIFEDQSTTQQRLSSPLWAPDHNPYNNQWNTNPMRTDSSGMNGYIANSPRSNDFDNIISPIFSRRNSFDFEDFGPQQAPYNNAYQTPE